MASGAVCRNMAPQPMATLQRGQHVRQGFEARARRAADVAGDRAERDVVVQEDPQEPGLGRLNHFTPPLFLEHHY